MEPDPQNLQEIPGLREKLLTVYVECLPGIALIKDLEGRCIFANPAWEKIFRKTRGEWLGKTSEELWPPKLAAKFNEHDRIVLRTKKPLLTVGTILQADGPHHWVSYRFPLNDAKGKLIMIGINAIDITGNIETTTRLEHWLDSSPTVIYAREPRGNFAVTYVSRNIQALLGWEPWQLIEDPQFWFNRIHPEDQPQLMDQLTLPWPADHQIREYRVEARDGAYHWIQDSFKMVRDLTGKPVEIAGVWMEITDRKTLEAQLLTAQKMQAVGRLAGGVAHDFNNLLMTIMGYGELMRTNLHRDDPLSFYVENILKATDRAAALTQQLLAFSRTRMLKLQVLNLNDVIADLGKMLQRILGENIELDIVADPDLGMVRADPGQIGQIMINLAINARDAMRLGGRLTVTTANIELASEHQCLIDVVPPGRYVRLSFTDNGCGMDESTLAHIFEPFFTTKDLREGTGLGLPVVSSIVKQHGAYIDVASQPGHGTVFTIYLPCLEGADAMTRDRIPQKEMLEGSETILIVEDERALRTLLGRFFRLYGYQVLEARDGDEALSVCQTHKGLIHIMLSDVVMPGMNGNELASHLSILHPEMRVFFMSGYPDSDLAPYGVLAPNRIILPKPFRPLDILKKLRHSLDETGKDPGNLPTA